MNDRGRLEVAVLVSFFVAMVAAIALAVVYWQGGQPQAEGLLLAATFGGIGVGTVIWAKAFLPNDEVTEARHPVASSEADIEAAVADLTAEGTSGLRRRRLVGVMAGGAFAALGAALVFPIRSLGPRPGRDLKTTPYAGGGPMRVVTANGRPVRPEDIEVGGVLTVWPEGHTDAADAPTLLIRPLPGQELRLEGEQAEWVVDGVVAYSKLCTHVGCPVGLYQAEDALLLCPCHQSTFDVLRGAKPVFGPAARSLPQLPLAVDGEGFIVATGDFESPVGAGFWDRGR